MSWCAAFPIHRRLASILNRCWSIHDHRLSRRSCSLGFRLIPAWLHPSTEDEVVRASVTTFRLCQLPNNMPYIVDNAKYTLISAAANVDACKSERGKKEAALYLTQPSHKRNFNTTLLLLSNNKFTLVIHFQPIDDEMQPPRTESHVNSRGDGLTVAEPLEWVYKLCLLMHLTHTAIYG